VTPLSFDLIDPNQIGLPVQTTSSYYSIVVIQVTKESTPPDGATFPSASRRNRRSPQLAGRKLRASGSNTRLAFPDSGCDARARHTGFEKNHPQQLKLNS
jgi:hypothetical protein